MLDYDNSAFYYFAITLTTLYLVPGTYYFLKALYEGTCADCLFKKITGISGI